MEHSSPRSPLDDLYWQDEILQVMYWLLGEGFANKVNVSDLRRFLEADPTVLTHNLELLFGAGLLVKDDKDFLLTDSGQEEAKRRFVDEFRPFLGRSGHGECSDDCWCMDPDHAGEECPSTVHQTPVAS
ncbi:MAG: hypothetical protein NVSMB52_15640 [Chloroflexota bacterium]